MGFHVIYKCQLHGTGAIACCEAARRNEVDLDAPHDEIYHPKHYTSHPSGVECIDVVEHLPFNVGNAIKYLWRAGLKGDHVEDLKKAAWYVNREIDRLSRGAR